jgi:hypothetical protein
LRWSMDEDSMRWDARLTDRWTTTLERSWDGSLVDERG